MPMVHAAEQGTSEVQICYDYTKGRCSRGANCRYSHDLATIVRVNSQERGVCFDFLRGSCNRGLLCRFSHDLSSIVAQQSKGIPPKRNAPICYDFVKGLCTRGTECRYSHDITCIIQADRGMAPSTRDSVCFDFAKGRCARGVSCRYSHDLAAHVAQGTVPPALMPSIMEMAEAAAAAAMHDVAAARMGYGGAAGRYCGGMHLADLGRAAPVPHLDLPGQGLPQVQPQAGANGSVHGQEQHCSGALAADELQTMLSSLYMAQSNTDMPAGASPPLGSSPVLGGSPMGCSPAGGSPWGSLISAHSVAHLDSRRSSMGSPAGGITQGWSGRPPSPPLHQYGQQTLGVERGPGAELQRALLAQLPYSQPYQEPHQPAEVPLQHCASQQHQQQQHQGLPQALHAQEQHSLQVWHRAMQQQEDQQQHARDLRRMSSGLSGQSDQGHAQLVSAAAVQLNLSDLPSVKTSVSSDREAASQLWSAAGSSPRSMLAVHPPGVRGEPVNPLQQQQQLGKQRHTKMAVHGGSPIGTSSRSSTCGSSPGPHKACSSDASSGVHDELIEGMSPGSDHSSHHLIMCQAIWQQK